MMGDCSSLLDNSGTARPQWLSRAPPMTTAANNTGVQNTGTMYTGMHNTGTLYTGIRSTVGHISPCVHRRSIKALLKLTTPPQPPTMARCPTGMLLGHAGKQTVHTGKSTVLRVAHGRKAARTGRRATQAPAAVRAQHQAVKALQRTSSSSNVWKNIDRNIEDLLLLSEPNQPTTLHADTTTTTTPVGAAGTTGTTGAAGTARGTAGTTRGTAGTAGTTGTAGSVMPHGLLTPDMRGHPAREQYPYHSALTERSALWQQHHQQQQLQHHQQQQLQHHQQQQLQHHQQQQ
eukprot:Lankesteria_metandrocarpae@DN7195_c0_g1_i1.p1